MASGFPGSIDNFTDPLTTSALNSPSHAGQHQDLNDAVEKIETYMGLVKVIPTSVTGGTLAANGTITVGSGVTSITVNGAFSSLYDNYKVVWTGGSGSGEIRVTVGASAAGYYGALMYNRPNAATPAGIGNNNIAYWQYGGLASSNIIVSFDLYAPFITARTGIYAQIIEITGAASAVGAYAGYHDSTSSFTSFTLAASAGGSYTGGAMRIYGYRN